MKITFQLDDEDLSRLRRVMQTTADKAKDKSEDELGRAALEAAKRARAGQLPNYIRERIATLEVLATMLRDREWALPQSVRIQVCGALAYFLSPDDMIPDHAPVLGFLDDAIVIELVAQEFKEEIQGYEEFCQHRGAMIQRYPAKSDRDELENALLEKRKRIRAKIQEKRHRDEEEDGPIGRLFRIWS